MKTAILAFVLIGFQTVANAASSSWIDSGLAPNPEFPVCKTTQLPKNETKIDSLIAAAVESDSQALIIVRNGCTVVEKHFGSPVDEVFSVQSVTKSVASLAVGQLLHDHLLNDLDTTLGSIFPSGPFTGKKTEITIRQLLSQTSGLPEWDAAPENAGSALARINNAPLLAEPGTQFSYSSMATYVLGAVIEKLTGLPASVYIQNKVLKPIGIRTATWDPTGQNPPHLDIENPEDLGGGLFVSSRDLLKLGSVMLHHGSLGQTQIFDRTWLDLSQQSSQSYFPGYGFLWWLYGENPTDHRPLIYSAVGYQGQFVTVVPDQDLVIVRIHRVEETTDQTRLQKIFMDLPDLLLQAE